MDIDFTDQVVLVTGSSRGIGRAIALEFAKLNAKVAVHYNKNKQAAENTLSELPGNNHIIVKGDLSDPVAVEDIASTVIEKFGKIDVLVNNAGIWEEQPIVDLSFEEWQAVWEKTIQTNLTGAANITFLVAKQMIKNGGGKIINVASRAAYRGEPTAPYYGASKAGLIAFGQSMARALGKYNILVYSVAPGFIQTEMVREVLTGKEGDSIRNQSPLGRIGTPEEVAHTVTFLAGKGTDFLTGCVVDINGASYLR